jgi:hypothetical protein
VSQPASDGQAWRGERATYGPDHFISAAGTAWAAMALAAVQPPSIVQR